MRGAMGRLLVGSPMGKLLAYLGCALLACACVFACVCMVAPGLVPTALAAGPDADIGELSSRYSQLDDLADSRSSDENVVVETRISVLAGANQALDGAEVRFQGEAVGEAVRAGEGLQWVSVNVPSGQALSVLLTDEQAAEIAVFGDYRHTGSTLQVTGIYHVACDEHQGELDVHASQVDIIEEGQAEEHVVSAKRLDLAIALVTAGTVLVVAYALLSRRKNGKGRA